MKLLKRDNSKKTEEEKVEERREEVLSKGRKFKYPLQWTKHRVVINTILIAFAILALIITAGWLALYQFGMTDDLLYRVTRIIPVSVASVDSEDVRFSDYLMLYRSSISSLERQSNNQFDNESIDDLHAEYKRSALTEAEEYALAAKLAPELDVTVTPEEVDAEFDRHLKIGGLDRSEESFMKIVEDNFGLSKDEYKRMLYLTLLKAKVETKIDDQANKIAKQVEDILASSDNDYEKVATELGDQIIYEETGGLVDSKNIDGGRATEAMKLEPGKSSGKFISMNGDSYYFIKLIKKTNAEVNFVSIKVPFTEFDQRFESLKNEGKIVEYITINIPSEEESTTSNEN
ncbi:SurA N-terminal domain-containing protein [Candidatus Saccharibacteria bacterium]|nr:SurA N-terminal domain-containing protein [Candidatus Saccharibacteria bacterium]